MSKFKVEPVEDTCYRCNETLGHCECSYCPCCDGRFPDSEMGVAGFCTDCEEAEDE